MAEIKLKANAKVNLFLDILDKRADGYHNIKTVFQEISLADVIRIKEKPGPRGGITVSSSDPRLPAGRGNLVHTAASAIRKYSGIGKGLDIHIEKNIPIGAGLGGGSSDAACVLKGLNRLWNLGIGRGELCSIAKNIGADVPFFIYGGRCVGEGIGDVLTPITVGKTEWYALVYPRFEISTKFVYNQLTETKKKCIIKNCYNKLESVVLPLYPEIGTLKERLQTLGAVHSLMSGSGSCVFGVVKDKRTGKKIIGYLKRCGYDCWLAHSVGGS